MLMQVLHAANATGQAPNPYITGVITGGFLLVATVFGTLLGWGTQTSTASRQRKDALAQALRTERRELYAKFLLQAEKTKQLVHRHSEHGSGQSAVSTDDLLQARTDLWAAQAELSLVAGANVHVLANAHATFRQEQVAATIDGLPVSHQPPTGASRRELRQAMRAELGVAD